ncbi:uracil-DNA glycosylase [Rubripirellula sp.]|nr:uracil-DNA glycosylase [Rubripirellula sp.]
MSNPNHQTEHYQDNLDPQQILEATSALARHLQQAGVQWLPIPTTKGVSELNQHFQSNAQSGQNLGLRRGKNDAAPDELPRPQLASRSGQDASRGDDHNAASIQQQQNPINTTNSGQRPSASLAQLPRGGGILSANDTPYGGENLPDPQRHQCLIELSGQVASCQRCPNLASKRTQTVFGEGSVRPRVVFFGEAPGADEDRTGRPFVGAAGQLLTKMIAACKFDRQEVYILNTIKCRPPNNRNPEEEERANCREYYQAQLNLLRPEYIICLGAVAAQELLQSKVSVGSLRGKFHRYHDSKVLVTYHPAYLLRDPSRKRAAWEDLQIMLRDAKITF